MFKSKASFFELNFPKVTFFLKLTVSIFLGIALILFVIHLISNGSPSIRTSIIILITYSVISDFIFFLAYFSWKFHNKKRSKIFNSPLFQPFKKHQTENSFIRSETKWYFTEETLTLHIEPFDIICNPSDEKQHIIDFNFQVAINIKENNIDEVIAFCKTHQLDLYPDNRINGLVQEVDLKNITADELYDKIISTAHLLKKRGFQAYSYSES